MLLQCIQAVESAVVEMPLAQVSPQLLHRIELGRIRRQEVQLEIGRQGHGAVVPTGTIQNHYDVLIGVATRNLRQE